VCVCVYIYIYIYIYTYVYTYIHTYIYEKDAAAAYDRSVEKAKWRIWKKTRLIACTAASAVHVTRRLMQVSFAYILGLFYIYIRLLLTLMHVLRRLMQAIDEEGMYIRSLYQCIRSLLPMY
jgi:hypothetical protein